MAVDPIYGSVIQGGSSLLGNIIGAFSQKSANKANYNIAQMNNKYNYLMMLKQMEYNQNMWNKQNEYNSPTAQMARLREAGINPYMALGMMSSGQAQSAGGVNTPSAQGAHMEAFKPDFSGIGMAAQNYIVNKQNEALNSAAIAEKNSVANYNNEQAKYYGAKAVAEMAETWSKTRDNNAKALYQETMNNYADDMFSSDRDYKRNLVAQQEVQTRIMLMQEASDRLRLNNLPQQLKAELEVTLAQTALLRAQGQLTKEQSETEIKKQLKYLAEITKQHLDNKLIGDTFDALVEKAKMEAAPKTGIQLGARLADSVFGWLKGIDWEKIHLRNKGVKPWD